jgi:hypothetical protein
MMMGGKTPGIVGKSARAPEKNLDRDMRMLKFGGNRRSLVI